jgi:glutaredoxin 3
MATNNALFSDMCKPQYLERLQQIFSEKQATVVSTTYCGYCNKAKKLLEKEGVEFREIMLDEIYGEDQMEVANCIYGKSQRFVPMIYMNQSKVGGYGELYQLSKDGQIKSTTQTQA